MKKQYAALAAFILITQCMQVISLTESEITRSLASHHNLAFGKDNLFAKQMNQVELSSWNKAIENATLFVEENSKNQLGIKDGDLMKALSTIKSANTDLQNTLKITYGLRNNKSGFSPQIDEFNKIKQAMITVRSNLKKAIFVLNKEQKMAAKNILNFIAMAIETTAIKAIKEIAKL